MTQTAIQTLKISKPKLGIACFGGCGVNTAKLLTKLDPKQHNHLHILAANTDARQLEQKFFDHDSDKNLGLWSEETKQLEILQLGKKGEGPDSDQGDGAGGDPEIGRQATQECEQEIKAFIEGKKAMILIGGLGGGTGTGALPLAARYCLEVRKDKPPLVVAVMPFAREHRISKALLARNEIVGMGIPTIIIYNENLPDKDVPMDEAWEKINESCLVPMLLNLKEMIQKVGPSMNTDLNDWHTVLRQGNRVLYGNCRVKDGGITDTTEVVKQLLTNPLQDDETIKGTRMFLMSYHGKWTVSEADEICSKIKEQVDKSTSDGKDPEVHEGHYKTEDGSRWMAMLAVSKEDCIYIEPEEEQKPKQETILHGNSDQSRTVRVKLAGEEPRKEQNPEAFSMISFFLEGDDESMTPRECQVNPKLSSRWNHFRGMIWSNARERVDELREIMNQIENCLPDEFKGRHLAPPKHLKDLFIGKEPATVQPEGRRQNGIRGMFNKSNH